MNILAILIPVTLFMGLVGLAAFFWSLRNGQYEDLMGDAERILLDPADKPLKPKDRTTPRTPEYPAAPRTKETHP